MLPRALVFSADEPARLTLLEALASVGFQVEECGEIFAAIEQVTSYSFKVIVADFGQALEAKFLLQTARDLKCNRSALSVALGDYKQLEAATELRPTAILRKPISPAQAVEALVKLGAPNPPVWQPPQLMQERQTEQLGSPVLDQVGTRADERLHAVSEASVPNRHQDWDISAIAPATVSPRRSRCWTATAVLSVLSPVLIIFSLLAYDSGMRQLAVRWKQSVFNRMANMNSSAARISAQPASQAGAPTLQASVPQLTDYILADYKLPDAPPGSLIAIPTKSEVQPPEIDTAAVQALRGMRQTSPPEYHVSIARTASSPEIPESLLLPSSYVTLAKTMTKLPDEERTLEPRKLSEEVSRALLIQQDLPLYPAQAKAAGLEGSVVLQALVGKDGTIRDVKLIRGHLLLGQAAAEAVKRWRYRPYRVNGQNLEVQTLITLEFRRNS